MNLNPQNCKRNRKILCGVVKNLGNCPFPDSERCAANNATDYLAMVNQTFGTITLKAYRYNPHKVKISVLERNMCDKCRVIWADPENSCLICG